jgi:hypothetical protein
MCVSHSNLHKMRMNEKILKFFSKVEYVTMLPSDNNIKCWMIETSRGEKREVEEKKLLKIFNIKTDTLGLSLSFIS